MRISYLITILFFISCGDIGDHNVDLGNGYYYTSEGRRLNYINRDTNNRIPPKILTYSFNDEHIIASQKPNFLGLGDPDSSAYGNDTLFYWIIDKGNDSFHGPLTRVQYDERRKTLQVSPDLTLEQE